MLRSRLTAFLKKLDEDDCATVINSLNQNDSEPDAYSLQFQMCNVAIARKAMAEWVNDEEKVSTVRCEFCAYDADTVYKLLEQICPD